MGPGGARPRASLSARAALRRAPHRHGRGFQGVSLPRGGHRDPHPSRGWEGQQGPWWRGEQRRGQRRTGVLSPSPSRGASGTGMCRDTGKASKNVGPRARQSSEGLAALPPHPHSLCTCTRGRDRVTGARMGLGDWAQAHDPRERSLQTPPHPAVRHLNAARPERGAGRRVRADRIPCQHVQNTRGQQPPRGILRTRG